MIFAVVILLLVGVVAYFHWVQGLFSGLISVTVAAVAAVLAVSYHEPLAAMLLQGKLSDQAYAVTLVALFALIYLIGRVIFDNFVPGNIRLPALVDKIGGGVTGFIAGMFALGIVAIAAQSLPFGASIAGYSRYTLKDSREVQLPVQGRGQAQDMFVNDEMKSDDVDPAKAEEGMILPVDDFVIGVTAKLSDGGSLEGARKLESVHPAYVNELYFQRAGVQAGAKHVALNTAKLKSADLVKSFAVDALEQTEGEMKEIRGPRKETQKTLTSSSAKQIVVVRIKFGEDATDDDHLVRIGGGSVRLVANGKNYLPVGTLHGNLLLTNKPDDFLVAKAEPVDFVFYVDREDALRKSGGGGAGDDKAAAAAPTFEFKKGTFIEVKRMVRFELSGPLAHGIDEPATGVVRKPTILTPDKEAASKKPAAQAAPPARSVGGISQGVGAVRAAEEEAAGKKKKEDAPAGGNAKPDAPN